MVRESGSLTTILSSFHLIEGNVLQILHSIFKSRELICHVNSHVESIYNHTVSIHLAYKMQQVELHNVLVLDQ